MNWFEQIDIYCERTDFTFWSEPINALSNLAFVLAAWLAWRMISDREDLYARLLTLLLGSIGIGSFLFHTFATRWAELADVLPIALFILAYFYASTQRFLAYPRWAGLLSVVAFFPYSIGLASVLNAQFGAMNGSVAYVPVVVLIVIIAALVVHRDKTTANRLFIGAGLLAASLLFRSIDMTICPGFPPGSHFLWHMINAAMLGWMIRTMHRHQFA